MIDYPELKLFSQDQLVNYLWGRFRLEHQDPPFCTNRFSEPPETFIYRSIINNNDDILKDKVTKAIISNLQKLTQESYSNNLFWNDPINDQHVASLFFLSSVLKTKEIYDNLYFFALYFLNNWLNNMIETSDGQFHALRFLSQYTNCDLSNFWNNILLNGPNSLETLCLQGLNKE